MRGNDREQKLIELIQTLFRRMLQRKPVGKSYVHIESDQKWFEPDDHIVGKFPEKLIEKEAGFADYLPSSFDKDRGEVVDFKRKDIEEMNTKENEKGFRISPAFSPGKREQACHNCKRQRSIKGIGRCLNGDIDQYIGFSLWKRTTKGPLNNILFLLHLFKPDVLQNSHQL